MSGMNRMTGGALTGRDHLRQSIADILTTPIGSRVMRRAYGSRLFQLIDAPLNASVISDIVAATAEAIGRWEPRFQLQKVEVERGDPGQVILTLTGQYLPDGQSIMLEGIEVD